MSKIQIRVGNPTHSVIDRPAQATDKKGCRHGLTKFKYILTVLTGHNFYYSNFHHIPIFQYCHISPNFTKPFLYSASTQSASSGLPARTAKRHKHQSPSNKQHIRSSGVKLQLL